MVKGNVLPIVAVVALRTLAGEVVGRLRMASLAIGQASVAKAYVAPIIRLVALRTLAREVVGRPRMAALAIG